MTPSPATPGPDFARLVRNAAVAVLVCAALVAVCYFFIDRPFATFVHTHRPGPGVADVLNALTLPPPVLQQCVPAVLAALVVRRAWGPFRRWELTLFAAGVGMVLADQFRGSLGYAFGRYWPETWRDDNPSYIGSGAYGFHPFHEGPWYGSFPSGHTTRMAAVAAVVWVAYPRWWWTGVLAAAAVAVGLLGMNYHFVGDVTAGAFVGGIVGAFAAHFCGLGSGGRRGVSPGRGEPGSRPGPRDGTSHHT